FTHGRLTGGATHQGLDAVVDVEEVPLNRTVAEHLNGDAVQRLAHEPVDDAILGVLHLGARAVDVGQPQQDDSDAVDLVVKLEDLFRGQVGYFVNRLRVGGRQLVDGQVGGRSVLPARAREDDPGLRIPTPDRLHHYDRSLDVVLDVEVRIGHAHDVGDL